MKHREETTRTRVFGLFVVTGSESLTLAQLVRLGLAVGLTASNVKSHISRMVADGSLLRRPAPSASRYAPSENRMRMVRTLRARLAPAAKERWNLRWWLVALDAPRPRAQRERARGALQFEGFRRWRGDAWLRPAWPAAGARSAVTRLATRYDLVACEGLIAGALDVPLTFHLDATERIARGILQRVEVARRRLGSSADSASLLKTRLALGGELAHFASDHPQLPPELLDGRRATGSLITVWNAFERDAERASKSHIDALLRGEPERRTA